MRRRPLSPARGSRLCPSAILPRNILRRLAVAVLVTMLPAPPAPAQNPPPSPTTLAALRDRFRPLLLFASSPEDPSLLAQMTRLKDGRADLSQRDVVLIAIPYNTPSPSDVSLTAADAAAARHRFHVAPDQFTAILLGKDGGEKLRSLKPVSLSKLRDLIDSMPMRQDEMQDPSRR